MAAGTTNLAFCGTKLVYCWLGDCFFELLRAVACRRLFCRCWSVYSDKSNRPMDGVGLARLLDGAAASSFGLQVPLVPLVASLQPVRPGSRPNEAFERGLRVSGSKIAPAGLWRSVASGSQKSELTSPDNLSPLYAQAYTIIPQSKESLCLLRVRCGNG